MSRNARGWWTDRRGNIAIMFGLALLPLATAVGAAVDYSRASSIHSGLQASTDSAALVACKSTSTTTAQLQAEAQSVISNAFPNNSATITAFTSANNPRVISLSTQVIYPTKFMKVANITQMTLGASSSCGAGEQFFEVAMVLDTTGSMSGSAGSQSKIQAMRAAAKSFVTTMFTSFDTTHLKMSLVPFAAAVKVDPTFYAPLGIPLPTATWMDLNGQSPIHWQNVANPAASGFTNRLDIFRKLILANPGWAWQGCFEALPYPYNTQDVAPSTATPGTLHVPLFAPDEEGTYMYYNDGNGNPKRDVDTVNSYIDDGVSWFSSTCNAFGADDDRMSRACKYVLPKSPITSEPGPNWGCTSKPLQRLTTSQSSLRTQIDALQASGQTNVAEGMHWGWQTISPNGVFQDGAAYTTPNLTKVVILMTDGVNTWNGNGNDVTGSEYSAYGYFRNANGSSTANRLPPGYGSLSSSGQARAAMDQVTKETCTNMKAANVVIYSVAFSTPGDAIDASGQALIKNCATSADKYFLASDTASLNSAFAAIAQGIGALRITR